MNPAAIVQAITELARAFNLVQGQKNTPAMQQFQAARELYRLKQEAENRVKKGDIDGLRKDTAA